MLSNFEISLQVMGIGLIGIFSVTIVLMMLMYLLRKLFPADADKKQKM
ncbi:MAG: hypothetical protein SPL99_08385 [Catonella sp.]|jgi:hypothetical protein|nr:hypothetical protein [Catonella sp.]MDY6356913.1 hypothetical protein [Catonella sp.]